LNWPTPVWDLSISATSRLTRTIRFLTLSIYFSVSLSAICLGDKSFDNRLDLLVFFEFELLLLPLIKLLESRPPRLEDLTVEREISDDLDEKLDFDGDRWLDFLRDTLDRLCLLADFFFVEDFVVLIVDDNLPVL